MREEKKKRVSTDYSNERMRKNKGNESLSVIGGGKKGKTGVKRRDSVEKKVDTKTWQGDFNARSEGDRIGAHFSG